eukprot:UN04398
MVCLLLQNTNISLQYKHPPSSLFCFDYPFFRLFSGVCDYIYEYLSQDMLCFEDSYPKFVLSTRISLIIAVIQTSQKAFHFFPPFFYLLLFFP